MSERIQRIFLWITIVLISLYGASMVFLFHMFPPPSAQWSAQRIAEFYQEHGTEIRIGAVICSYAGSFLLPISVVIAVQIRRIETNSPIWSWLALTAGALTTVYLVSPTIIWGVTAYTPTRAPEITATFHEYGVLSIITTVQYFIFVVVAVVVICLTPTSVVVSPFPRWFGYFSAFCALIFELGAVAFLPRTGPFAWNGLLAFWIPFCVFGVWLSVLLVLLFKALGRQSAESESKDLIGA